MNLEIKELVFSYIDKIVKNNIKQFSISFNNNAVYGTLKNSQTEIIISELSFLKIELNAYQYNCKISICDHNAKKISDLICNIQKQITLDFSKTSEKCLYDGFHNDKIKEYFIANIDLESLELNGIKVNTYYENLNLNFYIIEKN